MKKSNKKIVMPTVAYTVDFTDVDNILDVYAEYAITVLDKYCTMSDVVNFINKYGIKFCNVNAENCPECLELIQKLCDSCEKKKKPNIFKRFWNWLKK